MRPVALAVLTLLSACSSVPPAAGEPDSDTDTSTGSSGGDSTSEGGHALCDGGPWQSGQPIAVPELPAGDPAAGYEALLTEDYVSCGIPWELFGFAEDVLGVEEPLPGRTGKNAEVGHAWNVVTLGDGSELVVSNCLQCHAGYFDGELIVGLGKASADFTTSLSDFAEPLPDLPETSEANAAFNKFKARAAALGPYSTMLTIGANPAVMFAIILLSHRDPVTLAWSDEPRYELSTERVIPADPPPWWRVGKKASNFANGMSRRDHRGTMVLASSLCTDSVEEAGPVVDYFADIQAYLASLEAPRYPFAIDAALAADGAEIFECNCAGCHGTYADDPKAETYPNLLIPLDVIGTDPSFATLSAEGGFYHHLKDWFNESFYGMFSEVVTDDPTPGYTAPPLDGIWATAPYFHNGSVPSIALVLDSTARPSSWRRLDYDSTHFDQAALGWPWEPATAWSEAPVSERKFIYDTTAFGYGNGGHTFGDHLDDAERQALLEYLKTL
ncbi:c-type cytochrome [Nannocystis sp. ILAH1]|uniref:c-type cytochrome n=1 Tax=unclassified Nannocystis TaxID=2627009 RepID=UPI0022714B3E|nr:MULTISPECIES: c-type cytochrome [unclassified Nannocystis]MCY0991041.1 c-type cytochrome [Nannocystis sp. ILAH1]MCY1064551.1 c-type cytochrome [Nannocystis sp. RBIL2]